MIDEVVVLDALILVMMFMLGAIFGSFACCQAWRWHYKVHTKKDLGQWSVCLHCHKRIHWYDNIPIISWLVLRGKCRNCGKKIGVADFLSEISMAVSFLMLSWAYLLPMINNWHVLSRTPGVLFVQVAVFIMTLLMLVVLMVLAVYDAKWRQLPTVLLVLSVVIGAIILVLKTYQVSLAGEDVLKSLMSTGIGVVILAGVCFVVYKASRERLMGSGDWILALALALALADWWLALWNIFLANLLGDMIALPGAIKSGNHKVSFGPFLVAGFVLVLILGNALPLLLTATNF